MTFVERSGLNSSEVLATLFDLEMSGIVRQLPESDASGCCCRLPLRPER
jgi:hypothetical protein